MYICSDQNEVYCTNYVLDSKLQEFYNHNVVKNNSQSVTLCCETIKQALCKKWFAVRRLYFTASKDIHDIKVRRTKTIESLIEDKLQPKNLNTESTKYGINNEPVKITATQMSDGVTFASIRKSTSDRTLTLR